MIRLIVNADDFGEYRCVSAGILDCVEAGTVSATGVMTSCPLFAELVGNLKAYPWLDCGVHLNLSRGAPLTASMSRHLARWGGVFPGKGKAMFAVLSGSLPFRVVEEEWMAQIERALDAGLPIRFLNSHEHVHLLPPLRKLIVGLACRYDIPWVRGLLPETGLGTSGAWIRSLAAALLQSMPPAVPDARRLDCVGVAASGRLGLEAVRRIFERLPPDGVFELMCHPGRVDAHEITDGRLLAYHDWEGERGLLCSAAFVDLCAEFSVVPTRFSDIAYHVTDRQIQVCK